MTNRKIFFCVIVIVILLACGACSHAPSEKGELEKIENIWSVSDSSLEDAVRMADELSGTLKGTYARQSFNLLCIRLRDKQNVIPSSDDSVKTVYDFFRRHGNKKDLMRCYYYMGSVYRDLHDSPRAIVNFLSAADMGESGLGADTLLQLKCYSQLRDLYSKQLNDSASLEMALKGFALGEKAHALNPWFCIDVATAYCRMGDSLQAKPYVDRGYEMMSREQSFLKYPPTLAWMLKFYSQQKQMGRADSIATLLETLPENKRPHNYEACLGLYYRAKERADVSAAHFLNLYETTGRIASKCDAAAVLMDYYYHRGEYRKAMDYAVAYRQLNDAVIQERKFEQTHNARGEYLYQRDRAQETAVMQRAAHAKFIATLCVSALCIVFLGFWAYYLYKKKKVMEDLFKKELRLKTLSELAREYKDRLTGKESDVRELEEKLQETEEALKDRIIQNSTLMRLALMAKSTDNAMEVIEKFALVAQGKEKLTYSDWKELIGAVDTLYPDFREEVNLKINRISEPMLQTCYLLKAGFSNPQIVTLMDVPKQTVWNRVNKIKEVLGGL